MYDSYIDYLFELALDRLDEDEKEVKNRPTDDEDTWLDSCVSEQEWKRRNTIFQEEWEQAKKEIKEWREKAPRQTKTVFPMAGYRR